MQLVSTKLQCSIFQGISADANPCLHSSAGTLSMDIGHHKACTKVRCPFAPLSRAGHLPVVQLQQPPQCLLGCRSCVLWPAQMQYCSVTGQALDQPNCCACLTLTHHVVPPPEPLYMTSMLQTCKHRLVVQVRAYSTSREGLKRGGGR